MKLFIQEAAEQDILSQIEWYAANGVPHIASRFSAAAVEAIGGLMHMPNAGTPRASANQQLAGLRTWPVKGFDEHRVYYLATPELLTVVRVLHSKRNVDAILEDQTVTSPAAH